LLKGCGIEVDTPLRVCARACGGVITESPDNS
jgi:hypothetical protein